MQAVVTISRPTFAVRPLAIATTVAAAAWFSRGLAFPQQAALLVFLTAILLWTLSEIEESYVALGGALALVMTGAAKPDQLYDTLGDSTTWLMLGSFVIAAAVKASGLSQDFTWRVLSRARSVEHLLYLLAGAVFLTAFLIPATSARAALAWPVYVVLREQIPQPRVHRALAILIPAIVLLSAFASLTGAGAHLVTADLIARSSRDSLGYVRWLSLGLPFALVSCLTAVVVISRLFLTREERRQALGLDAPEGGPKQGRRFTASVVTMVVVLWCTEPWHGSPAAVIALLGALLVTLPGYGPLSLKQALREVEWNLLLFLAGTLLLSECLVAAGGFDRLIASWVSQAAGWGTAAVMGWIATLSLLSHLVIHSRTARSSILIPVVLVSGSAFGFNPVALAFLSTAAAGYCLTLPVSAKPVALFAADDQGFTAGDLLKLGAVLLPVHLVFLFVFAFWVWPAQGLHLFNSIPR